MRHALIAACQAALIFGPAFAQEGAGARLRTITTNGEAVVKVVPDEVVLTLGVTTLNKDMFLGRKAHDVKVKAVSEVAVRAGISTKDVQTDFLHIEPKYEDSSWSKLDDKGFIGYLHQTTIVITLRDIGKFETLLTGVLQAGAGTVHGIDFQTSQLRKHRDQARSMAIKAAKEKAVALAADLDQKVGRPQTIHEGQQSWWSSYRWWGGRGFQSMSQNVVAAPPSGSESSGALAPGTISVRADVNVVFDLE